MNPFVYQNFCSDSFFCPPIKTIHKLENMIIADSNVLISSAVRYGKTSLVQYYLENKIDKNQYLTFYFDFFNTNNYIDFVKIIYKQIAQYLPYDYNMTLKVLKELFNVVRFNAVIDQNGILEFTPNLNSYNFDELMSDIYKGLMKLSVKSKKKVILAFDEFQQVLVMEDSNVKKGLKRCMDQYPEIRYIFIGSKKYLMEETFFSKTSLLSNQAQKLEFSTIEADEIFTFINTKFNNSLSRELFNKMHRKTKGNIGLIQEVCYHLYYYKRLENKELEISENDIETVCNRLLNSKSEYYKLLLNRLSTPHKIAIKAVIISGGYELYTKNNLFKLQVTKSSLNTAIKYLYKEELIDKDENNRYFIVDSCFELWYHNILLQSNVN